MPELEWAFPPMESRRRRWEHWRHDYLPERKLLMTMSARAGILYQAPRGPQRRPEPTARAMIWSDGMRALSGQRLALRHQPRRGWRDSERE